MGKIKNKIKNFLTKKNLTIYKLAKLMDFSEGALRKMLAGKAPFSETAVEKLLPILEISFEEFESMVVADKFSKALITIALTAKQNFKYKKKLSLQQKLMKFSKRKKSPEPN